MHPAQYKLICCISLSHSWVNLSKWKIWPTWKWPPPGWSSATAPVRRGPTLTKKATTLIQTPSPRLLSPPPHHRTIFRSRSNDNRFGENRGRSEPEVTRSQSYGSTGECCGTGTWTPDQVDQLRRRIKFFFMDPCSKFKARRHIPWKLMLQIIKIIIITVQLVQFGAQRSDIVEYFEQNQKALEHLLLKNWDPSYETMPYPPATGDYALYSVDDLLDYIDFAWRQYHNLSESALATFNLIKQDDHRPVPMRLCNSFNNYQDFHNGSYIVGRGVLHNCTDLVPLDSSKGQYPYDIRTFLKEHNITIPFLKLLDLSLTFSFTTFHLNLMENRYGPTCYYVNATILFKNYERSGEVLIDLLTKRTERECSGKIMTQAAKDEEHYMKVKSVALDSSVIVICALSSILCIRSHIRAWRLKGKTERLFRERFGKKLKFSDRMEFVNLWYLLIIINDVFTIIGSAFKIRLETRTVTITSHNYDFCSLLLGLGGLMAWVGCLRYLGFFKKYNILILTLKTAFPNVLRFMVCTLAIYFGFMFCGWVILGPYHIKFRHLSTTSECLYSLVNGDDMFVTFTATQTDNDVVWYFSRIYLYIFISLFIYCVLSLFISVIMDTYENLKEYYENGFPKTDLQAFLEECNTPLHSGLYRKRYTENAATIDCSLVDCLTACCCRRRRSSETLSEQSHLLTRTI
ncbi:mucolipin-3-like [Babylonia areolata]|uniref:mucolipin-3-like n=1 Tax=Babylonia areolata TaxID=304850 RepID=UPI003FD53405